MFKVTWAAAAEAGARAGPSVVSVAPSSDTFPFLCCPSPGPSCTHTISHSSRLPGGCQISSSAVTSALPSLLLLPNGDSRKNIEASTHRTIKIKVLHRIYCISLEFCFEMKQTNKKSGSIKISRFSIFRRNKTFLFYSEKAFHC